MNVGLCRLLASSRLSRFSAVLTATTAFLIEAAVAVLFTLTMTPAQHATQMVGSYDSVAYLAGGGVNFPVAKANQALRKAGASSSSVTMDIVGLFESLRGTAGTEGRVVVLEGDYGSPPDASLYRLVEGRWPASPGEAVASAEISRTDTLSDINGLIKLSVVGTIEPIYNRNYLTVITAPGTSAAWPWAKLHDFNLEAVPTVRWSGLSVSTAAKLLASLGQDMSVEDVTASVFTRTAIESKPQLSPATVGAVVLPIVLLDAAIGVAIGAVTAGRYQRLTQVAGEVGVPLPSMRVALLSSQTFVMGVASLGGALLGFGGVALLRPLLGHLVPHPLAPIAPTSLLQVALPLLLVLMATVSTVGFIARPGRAEAIRRGLHVALQVGSRLRRPAAVVLALLVPLLMTMTRRSSTVYILLGLSVAAAGLLAPDLIALATRRPRLDLRDELARRLLRKTRLRAASSVATLSLVLGLPLSTGLWAYTGLANTNAKSVAQVPPGTMSLNFGAPSVRSAQIQREIESAAALPSPVAIVNTQAVPFHVRGAIAATATPVDASRWLGHPLSGSEQAVLLNGGFLLLRPHEEQTGQVVVVNAVTNETVDLQFVRSTGPVEYEANFAGVALESTLKKRLGNSVLLESIAYYSPVTTDQTARAEHVLAQHAIRPETLGKYKVPDQFTLPIERQLALGVFGVIAGLVSVALSRSAAREVRPYLGALAALGLRRRWLSRIVWWQSLMCCGIAVLLMAAGVTYGLTVAYAMSKARVLLPWAAIVAVLVTCVVMSIFGTLAGLRRLTPTDRLR